MIRLVLLTDFTEAFAHYLLKGILNYSKGREPWVVCRMPPSFRQQYGIDGVLEWMKKWEADAIIAQFDVDDQVNEFKENGIVALAQVLKSRFSEIPNITSDYQQAGELAANFFLQKGFRNFAFYGNKNLVWSEGRCRGFRNCINEKGYGKNFYEYKNQEIDNLWFYESGPLADWLLSLPKRTALMACDDNQGNKIMEVCRLIGIKVPEEISVIGVDDDETICNLSDPPLSSIRMDVEKGGYEAAELIDNMLRNHDFLFTDVCIEPIKIVNRLSTDIYSTDDPYVLTALKYISQHLIAGISVTDVVKQVPLSRRLLEIRFKQVTNQPIYQYIFNLRMERFAQLLLESDASIGEIALSVGLTDYKNLARQFKVQMKCLPSEYRKSHEAIKPILNNGE
jgi:LacI family transcriptional regulator